MRSKLSIFVIFATVCLLCTSTASAVDYNGNWEDPTGDLMKASNHAEQADGTDVDIISIETSMDGDNILFRMEVSGIIKNSTDETDYTYSFFAIPQKDARIRYSKGIKASFENGDATYTIQNRSVMYQADYEINDDNLTIKVPASRFSSYDEFYVVGEAIRTDYVDDDNTVHGAVDECISWEASTGDQTDNKDGQNETDGVNETDDQEGLPSIGMFMVGIILLSTAILFSKKKD